jgi:putative transposase
MDTSRRGKLEDKHSATQETQDIYKAAAGRGRQDLPPVGEEQSRGTYGSPRVTEELEANGFEVDRKRVARRMAELGLSGDLKPKFRNADSEPAAEIATNVLERRFGVDEPDRVWVSDITYVWTAVGWLYLAVVIDLYSRRVVGWAMADHMRAELVLEALSAALGSREPSDAGLLFHSDQGSQYTATRVP